MFSAATKTDNVSSAANYIEDVFSTYLYTGTGAAQSINNGIGLGNSAANNSSISLNASTPSYLTFSSQVNLSGNFCIQAWVYPTSLTGTRLLFSSTSDNNVQMPRIQENGGIYCYVNGTEITSGATASALQANVWTHLAMTRSGSTFRIFVNGTLYATATYSGTFNVGVLGVFFFNGSLFGTPYAFGGNISNAQIVSGSAIYTTDFTPPQNTLIGGSVLLGAGATPLADTSGTGKTVTQFGSPAASSSGPWSVGGNNGGLVWCKSRTQATSHGLFDTARGVNQRLSSNGTGASANDTSSLTSFNSNGFSLGSDPAGTCNTNADNYVSWTFREQAKFFDVVTFTTSAAAAYTFNHNLGSTPGFVIIRATSVGGAWYCYHTSLGVNKYLLLNTTDASGTNPSGNWAATSTTFTVPTDFLSGGTQNYVAYLFAHDAGGFGLTGTDNVISCGSFTTDGSGIGTVTLGYEPQWVMVKSSSDSGTGWQILDIMRGWVTGQSVSSADDSRLDANTASAEFTSQERGNVTSTGFIYRTGSASQTCIYIAIRRGPMKIPTSGTSVFSPQLQTPPGGSYVMAANSGFPVDWLPTKRPSTVVDWFSTARLTNNYLSPNTTSAEGAFTYGFDLMQGVRAPWDAAATVSYAFRRAPGFFDVVCYTGNGAARTINHNLAVVPELMIIKSRSSANNWPVYHSAFSPTETAFLNLATNADPATPNTWNSTAPTSSVFSLGAANNVNQSGQTFVAYLFATCPGVSKVGSYTGTGALQTINCGFASGARFVMIKRYDDVDPGAWYVWDSARGISSGNDPYLLMNSTAAEVTNTNFVDTTSVGFQVTAAAPAAVNGSGGLFIFLAIA
jgi:hypothetical protein